MKEIVNQYGSLVVGSIALVISIINMIVNIKKNHLEKSSLRIDLVEIKTDVVNNLFPTNENGRSYYHMNLNIKNIGYREESIIKIVCVYNDFSKDIEYSKSIKPKSQEYIMLSIERDFVLRLKKILIIPYSDRRLVINEKQLEKWKKTILRRIEQIEGLKGTW